MTPLVRLLFLALLALPARAALPPQGARYALDCLPGDATGTMASWLRTRLTLRGFDEDAAHPALRLCFRIRDGERVWADDAGVGFGVGHRWQHGGIGAFGGAPVYRVLTVREVTLNATRAGEPAPYWEDSEALADRGEAALETAIRTLIERLPAPR